MQQFDSQNKILNGIKESTQSTSMPEILSERYNVECKLGEGGMGIVYRAHDRFLDQLVSIKLLRSRHDFEASALRFQREAKAASQLKHENLATVLDFGVADDGTLYMVSNYIDAVNLKDHIRNNSYLSIKNALSVLEQISDCMQYIHGKGILHRDIKSSNILIKNNDQSIEAYLLDFGIAKTNEIDELKDNLTTLGSVIGSPNYISPEQASGMEVDFRSDIYSLGVVAFEIITGRLPFLSDTTFDIIRKQKEETAPSLTSACLRSDIPDELSCLVEKMLEKDPANRIQTMQEVKDSFHSIQQLLTSPIEPNEPKQANIPKIFTSPLAQMRDGKGKVILIVAGIAAAILLFVVLLRPIVDPAPKPVEHQADGVDNSSSSLMFGINSEALSKVEKQDSFLKGHGQRSYGGTKLLTVRPNPAYKEKEIDWSELFQIKENFYLFCEDNTVEYTTLEKILKISYLKGLNLGNSIDFTDKTMALLAKRKDMVALRFSWPKQLTPKGYEELGKIKSLFQLEINHGNMGPEKVAAISKIKSLRSLKLRYDALVTDNCVSIICKNMPELESLTLEECSVTGKTLNEIAKLKNLDRLYLQRSNITDQGIERLVQSNTKIETLDLNNTQITKTGFKNLKKLVHLKELTIANCENLSQYEIENYSKAMKFRTTIPSKQKSLETYLSF